MTSRPTHMPSVDNANYLWIQLFYSALDDTGRAGFVMANSASDARGSELEIRKHLIQSGSVDVMIAIGSNFFYTVTLPCTLWFLDRGKQQLPPAQVEFLANIVRLYRGREIETTQGSADLMAEHFFDGVYQDVPGLCKIAAMDEVEAQGWSLNPGRYVGVPERVEEEGFDFGAALTALHEELETLNAEAHELEERITGSVTQLLDSLQ